MEINVAEANQKFMSLNGVLFNKAKTKLLQYPAGSPAEVYQLPDSVTAINDFAFYYCTKLKSVVLPQGLLTIDSRAFKNCTALTSVTIPDTVYYIGSNAFTNCENLKEVNVNTGSEYYYSVDGVLFDKVNKILVQYPSGKTATSYRIPDGVNIIGCSAFYECNNLKTVTIPQGVTGIESEAFWFCEELSSVNFPNTLVSIGYRAFYGCKNLKSVKIPESVTDIGYTSLGYNYNEETFNDGKTEGFIIYGFKGTAAEAYANQNGFTFLINHTPSDWITDKEATCTQNGSRHKECTVCGEVIQTQTMAKKGHTSSSWITDTKATVYKGGSKHKECTVCGETLETAKIPQLKPGRTTVKATTTSTGVKISWSKVTGADSYTVYRKTGSGSYKAIKTVTGTSYTDTTAKNGTKYTYNVKAKNEAGYGEYAKSGVTKLFLSTPKVTVANASSGVTVKWNKITGAKGYYVYRKTGSGSYTKIATIKSGSTVSYTDKKQVQVKPTLTM